MCCMLVTFLGQKLIHFCLQPELYLCTPVKVDFTKNYYITGFEPNATMETAHHMLVYGCTNPGSNKPVWNCGEMGETASTEETASPCSKGSQVMMILV